MRAYSEQHGKARHGFSLVELLVFIVLVSILLVGLVGLFTTNVRGSVDPMLRQQALEVANAYMDTVKSKKWNHNTPAGGGCVNSGTSCPSGPAAAPIGNDGQPRALYDDVDDYNGIDEAPATLDAGGSLVAIPELSGYRVQVFVNQPSTGLGGIPPADLRRILVRVTAPDGQTIELLSYRVNY